MPDTYLHEHGEQSFVNLHSSYQTCPPNPSEAATNGIGSNSNSSSSSSNSHCAERNPPTKPNPSLDPGVVPPIESLSSVHTKLVAEVPQNEIFDVGSMDAVVALAMLDRGVQALADITGDIPPTPPVSRPTTPTTTLKELRAGVPPLGDSPFAYHRRTPSRPVTPSSSVPSHDIQAPTFRRVEIGSPEAHLSEPTVLEEVASRRAQSDAIARKFFSKRPPAVSIHDYLLRMHRYCPMSTAVYLAAGVYIHRLAVEDKTVPVTSRTVHRLLLACLRVAMKALEDLSYPHQRFAGVGGVSQKELAKLEVSLCYLLNFDLRVDNAILYEKARSLQQYAKMAAADKATAAAGGFQLSMPLARSRKKALA